MCEVHPMSRLLAVVWGLADGLLPTGFDFDYLQDLHLSVADAHRLSAAGLLSPGDRPRELICSECGEYNDVIYMDNAQGERVPYLPCYGTAAARVAPERLQTWNVTLVQILATVFRPLGWDGTTEELARERIWRLGRQMWAGASWTVFLARGLRRRDTLQLLAGIRFPARSVIFSFSDSLVEAPEPKTPPILRLVDTVSCDGVTIRIDKSYIEEQLAQRLADDAQRPAPARRPRRGPRAAHIELLVRALEDHLRAARDFAIERLERTGAAEALPRPTMGFLARQLGVDKATVSRCLGDKRAGELRLLWALADDPERLLSAALQDR